MFVQWMNEASHVLGHVPPMEFNRVGFISPRLTQATLSQIATRFAVTLSQWCPRLSSFTVPAGSPWASPVSSHRSVTCLCHSNALWPHALTFVPHPL